MFSKFKTADIWLILLPLFLSCLGIAVIYSITLTSSGASLAIRQSVSLIIGIIIYFFFAFIDYRAIRSWAWPLYILTLFSLLAVKIFGQTTFGSQRWIDFGFFQFQPSELAKLAIIIIMANLFTNRLRRIHSRRLAMSILLIFIPVIMVLTQPDLGSAIVLTLTGLAVIFSAGLSKKQWLFFIIGTSVVMLFALLAWQDVKPFSGVIKDYQRERVETFINPDLDPTGAGYNVLQAIIAVGSGGISGKGLGFGSQSQLNFLPVAHTDFIFASIAESWGFVGSVFILILYGLLIGRVINAATIAKDDFSMLLCSGIAAMLIIQLVVNVGMNLQLLPVTGITLPLISFGGSSMLTVMAALGIVQSVVVRYKRITFY